MGNEHTSMRIIEKDSYLTTSRDLCRQEDQSNDFSKRRFSVDVTKAEFRRKLSKPTLCQSNSSSTQCAHINTFKHPRHQARAQSSNQLVHNTTNNNLCCSPPFEKPSRNSQRSPSGPLSPAVESREPGRHRRMSVDNVAQHRTIAAVAAYEGEGGGSPQRRYSRTTAGKSVVAASGVGLQSTHRRFSRPINQQTEGFSSSAMDGGRCLAEQLKLSSYQTLMLQQTWPRIKSTVFSSVFRQLTQKNAVAKELFQKMSIVGGFSASKCCDQKEHVQLLIELFEVSIQELNSPCKIAQIKCLKIGEMHFPVSNHAASVWDDLGDCLTESVSKAEAVRGKREAFRAWISLISFLIDSMKAGYMAQSKRRSVSSLSRLSKGEIVTSSYCVHSEERLPSVSWNRKES